MSEKNKIELTNENLKQVNGGSTDSALINTVMKLSNKYNLGLTEDLIKTLISKGGSVLRNYVKQKLPEGSKDIANIIPCF